MGFAVLLKFFELEARFPSSMSEVPVEAVMGQNVRDMASVAVTKAEHQVFTNAWRAQIPWGAGGTGMATRAQVEAAARRIYADYPEILLALGL